MMNTEKLSHAYIITGVETARLEKAKELCMKLLCQSGGCGVCRDCGKVLQGIHPDIIFIRRLVDDEGKMKKEIVVDQIRWVVSNAPVLPNDADRKVYIIDDAGAMNTPAQNALLKLLEEPPSFVSFLLLTENAKLLLETVRSRCAMINIAGSPPEDAPQRELAEEFFRAVASGNKLTLLRFANTLGESGSENMLKFVYAAIELASDMLCFRAPDMGIGRKNLVQIIGRLQKARDYLHRNVSAKHVAAMLSVTEI